LKGGERKGGKKISGTQKKPGLFRIRWTKKCGEKNFLKKAFVSPRLEVFVSDMPKRWKEETS